MTENVLLGPFLGDWETEIIIFRPYMKWLSNIVDCENIFLSTHNNRFFLYDWIPENNKISIYNSLSRDELSQKGAVNTTLNQKDYLIIQKQILQKLSMKNIYIYSLNYTKRTIYYPYYKRIFTKIPYEKIEQPKYAVFIPDVSENINNINNIYNEISNDIIVCGDMKIHLQEKNVVLKDVNYFDDGYKNIINIISNAAVVICPLSHWTLICRIQGIPVVSWITKKRNKYIGLESNKNNKCRIINDTNIKVIKSVIKSFMKENM